MPGASPDDELRQDATGLYQHSGLQRKLSKRCSADNSILAFAEFSFGMKGQMVAVKCSTGFIKLTKY
ncbi:hypothetical protein Zmor_026360 [Zophobas morio]|uniref:Uncharacterized protein n=1 Tax=Zophobas morio TaxID=2755281 RepID=A0AA38HV76_9CUCU|nr:hypothetical protein Zmor_026360 [Zophobas morio]